MKTHRPMKRPHKVVGRPATAKSYGGRVQLSRLGPKPLARKRGK